MANVPESATFDAGIYQIEITDAVIGGVNGISNLQAKGLANRTTWLKAQVDALNLLKGTGIPIFSAANSYAGGQQVIYQKNIWQANTSISPGAFNSANWTRQLGVAAESALADAVPLVNGTAAVGTSTDVAREDHVHPTDTSRAPLASPNFTGSPTAPTPVQFGNGSGLATTEFVQRALGNFKSAVQYNTSQTLTVAMVGQAIQAYGTSALTFTLPLVAGPPDGGSYFVANGTNKTLTLQVSGTDPMYSGNSGIISTLAIPSGSSVTITRINGQWFVCGPGALLNDAQFGSLLGSSGYQKCPSGGIDQWGNVSAQGNGTTVVTLPVAYPNVMLVANITPSDAGTSVNYRVSAAGTTKTTLSIANTSSSPIVCFWRTFGY